MNGSCSDYRLEHQCSPLSTRVNSPLWNPDVGLWIICALVPEYPNDSVANISHPNYMAEPKIVRAGAIFNFFLQFSLDSLALF